MNVRNAMGRNRFIFEVGIVVDILQSAGHYQHTLGANKVMGISIQLWLFVKETLPKKCIYICIYYVCDK